MKLNNKGFTTVEVLICFVIVSVVMMSLFSIISAYNEKRINESYRSRVYEYKNSLTNTIQDDFIKKGLTFAKVSVEGSPGSAAGRKYTVDCSLKNGEERRLIIFQRFTKTAIHPEGNINASDDFYIEYGPPDSMLREPFPNLGEIKGNYSSGEGTFVKNDSATNCGGNPCIFKDFQINNVLVEISNEDDPNEESRVLSIYIGFYHPDLGTKYAINIVAPIDYQASVASKSANFPTSTNCSSTTGICM